MYLFLNGSLRFPKRLKYLITIPYQNVDLFLLRLSVTYDYFYGNINTLIKLVKLMETSFPFNCYVGVWCICTYLIKNVEHLTSQSVTIWLFAAFFLTRHVKLVFVLH